MLCIFNVQLILMGKSRVVKAETLAEDKGSGTTLFVLDA